jgi:hypothetical protein
MSAVQTLSGGRDPCPVLGPDPAARTNVDQPRAASSHGEEVGDVLARPIDRVEREPGVARAGFHIKIVYAPAEKIWGLPPTKRIWCI